MFDDQNMEIANSVPTLPSESASTLEICKDLCHNYQYGAIQCWAIKYQAAANKCYMYTSINPQEYLSTKINKNKNMFYSTRECFSCRCLWFCVGAICNIVINILNFTITYWVITGLHWHNFKFTSQLLTGYWATIPRVLLSFEIVL